MTLLAVHLRLRSGWRPEATRDIDLLVTVTVKGLMKQRGEL